MGGGCVWGIILPFKVRRAVFLVNQLLGYGDGFFLVGGGSLLMMVFGVRRDETGHCGSLLELYDGDRAG